MTWLSTRERGDGYYDAMREQGIEPIVVHEEDTTVQTGYHAGHELLGMDVPPDAAFAVNDAMALGIMKAAREMGVRVPEDLSVVGFDDISMAESAHPPLTTVHIAKETMGELAARRLLDLMGRDAHTGHSENYVPVKSVVGVTLILRASCGCAAEKTIKGVIARDK